MKAKYKMEVIRLMMAMGMMSLLQIVCEACIDNQNEMLAVYIISLIGIIDILYRIIKAIFKMLTYKGE